MNFLSPPAITTSFGRISALHFFPAVFNCRIRLASVKASNLKTIYQPKALSRVSSSSLSTAAWSFHLIASRRRCTKIKIKSGCCADRGAAHGNRLNRLQSSRCSFFRYCSLRCCLFFDVQTAGPTFGRSYSRSDGK